MPARPVPGGAGPVAPDAAAPNGRAALAAAQSTAAATPGPANTGPLILARRVVTTPRSDSTCGCNISGVAYEEHIVH